MADDCQLELHGINGRSDRRNQLFDLHLLHVRVFSLVCYLFSRGGATIWCTSGVLPPRAYVDIEYEALAGGDPRVGASSRAFGCRARNALPRRVDVCEPTRNLDAWLFVHQRFGVFGVRRYPRDVGRSLSLLGLELSPKIDVRDLHCNRSHLHIFNDFGPREFTNGLIQASSLATKVKMRRARDNLPGTREFNGVFSGQPPNCAHLARSRCMERPRLGCPVLHQRPADLRDWRDSALGGRDGRA